MIDLVTRKAVDYPAPFANCVVELAESAHRYLYILSPQLDARVFDSEDLASALLALTQRGRDTEIRMLVADSRPLVERGHRLLQLARGLPSKISLKVLAEHPQWKGETLVVRDRDGLLLSSGEDGRTGLYCPDSRADTLPRIEWFNELWCHSQHSPELRSLQL